MDKSPEEGAPKPETLNSLKIILKEGGIFPVVQEKDTFCYPMSSLSHSSAISLSYSSSSDYIFLNTAVYSSPDFVPNL